MKKVIGNLKPILITLGLIATGFLVCYGLIVIKVIIINS